MDSASTSDLPVWGYSLRYQYGIFKQVIDEGGNQVEVPDPWLDTANVSPLCLLVHGHLALTLQTS